MHPFIKIKNEKVRKKKKKKKKLSERRIRLSENPF